MGSYVDTNDLEEHTIFTFGAEVLQYVLSERWCLLSLQRKMVISIFIALRNSDSLKISPGNPHQL